jgi:prolyl oligopeptidase
MLYLIVEKNAPNRKLVQVDMSHPDIANAKEILPASEEEILVGVYAARDALYVLSKSGVKFQVRRMAYGKPNQWRNVHLPYPGGIFTLETSNLMSGINFALRSWVEPSQRFQYDPASNKMTELALVPKNPTDFSSLEAREVEARSADGTMVPLSVFCKKGIQLDGSHPTLFEGYGAYGDSIDPYFEPAILAWIERGGVLAWAHVRGGGEFGERWHNAGRKETKQHTIDDMIAAAHYLIDNRYTSPDHLAVRGTSAGGIAVGGALVQYPELFAAAIDNVGATDLLRFQNTPGGAANIPEFGDVAQPDGFKYLFAVSPYHHVVEGTKYPAVMGITGSNDPRVPSWVVAKMIARLQAATTSSRPVLLRVDFDEGHGLESTRSQFEQVRADEWSFILWQMGDPEFQVATEQTNK